MLTIIKFEWKKIFRSKLNIIAVLAGWILIILCAVTWITHAYYYDSVSEEYIYGIEAIRVNQEKKEALTDRLTEEFLTQTAEEIQTRASNEKAETGEDYYVIVRDKVDLAALLAVNYARDSNEWVEKNWGILGEIPTEGGIHFYEQRMNKINNYMNAGYSYGDYSEQEKQFWMDMVQRIETPFLWGDNFSMDCILDVILLGFYLLLAIAVCIAPLFASEYEARTDCLLLVTKYGKTRLITAKILTAVSFAVLYFLWCTGTGAAIIVFICGFKGSNLPIQLWDTVIPYHFTALSACGIALGLMLLLVVAVTLFTLLLSSRVKSSFLVLVIDFVLLIGPAFLPFSKTSRLWNQIIYLLPVHAFNLKDILKCFNSYQFGNIVISYLGMVFIVYFVAAAASLGGIRGGFGKHQVR